MAKHKRENEQLSANEQIAAVMAQSPKATVEAAREMMQQATDSVRNGTSFTGPEIDLDAPVPPLPKMEGGERLPPVRRKARRNATERTYFVVGRPHEAAPLSFIMEAPTVGQCRKRLEMVKTMPAYSGFRLRCVRVTYVG